MEEIFFPPDHLHFYPTTSSKKVLKGHIKYILLSFFLLLHVQILSVKDGSYISLQCH